MFMAIKKLLKVAANFLLLPILLKYKNYVLIGFIINCGLVWLARSFLFTPTTTFEDLLTFSVVNGVFFSLILYIHTIFSLLIVKSKTYIIKGQAFILGVCLIIEFILILILFDGLVWCGIRVTIKNCPWIYIRPFMMFFFIIIFCLIIRFSHGLLRDYFPDEINSQDLDPDSKENKK